MLETIVVLALCGVAGGWLIARSALTLERRDAAARARDVARHALAGTLLDLDDEGQPLLDPPYGLDDIDTRVLPELPDGRPTGRQARRLWWWWRACYLLTCNVCLGWWVVAATLGLWSGVAALSGPAMPLSGPQVAPTLGAAWALHTIITSAGNRLDIW